MTRSPTTSGAIVPPYGSCGVFRQHDFPEQRAVHAAHRDEMRVVCHEKDARAEHRDAAIETDRGVAAQTRRARAREAPDLAAGRRVDRRHLIGGGDVHDAVEHERRHLVVEAAHGVNPLQRQVPHVRCRNLRERAVTVSIEPSVIRRPVAGARFQNLGEVVRRRIRRGRPERAGTTTGVVPTLQVGPETARETQSDRAFRRVSPSAAASPSRFRA